MKLSAATTIFYHGTFAITVMISTNNIGTMFASATTTKQALRGSNRHLSGCPSGGHTIYCGDYDYGGYEYENLCKAEEAGYSENQCWYDIPQRALRGGNRHLSRCPSGGQPVICGYFNIYLDPFEFENMCKAKEAGFSDDDCENARRNLRNLHQEPDDDFFEADCPDNAESVVCGDNDEVFDNLCKAKDAGYSEDDCEYQRRNLSYSEDSGDEGCQVSNEPVVCGEEGEEFLNLCLAGLAGFSIDDCHDKHLVTVITNTTNTTITANTTNSTYPTNTTNLITPCTKEYAPVVCGEVGYGNLCLAKQAGNSADDCEPDPLIDISFTIQIHDNLTDVDQPALQKFDFDAPLP